MADPSIESLNGVESRTGAFSDGAHGGDITGSGTHQATSIQQNIDPAFQPHGMLELGNYPSRDGQSEATFQVSDPMDAYHAQQAKAYGQGGMSGVMNQ